MVPVKITLFNFLSYGEEAQTLDFSRFHVACLSGRNGQGKSALLDALTWALWGEARKSSGAQKPDEELLRIGSRRMSVEFLFDVEGDRYRVIRSYSRSATGKTSKSSLELQLIDSGAQEGIPLTRASIRETQETLNERLGLDYDTFVNSAFLLQGRSDEFTKKKPSERKNILGRILNLGKYDRLADKARLCQAELRTETEKLNREVEIFSDILGDEIELRSVHSEAAANLKNWESELKTLDEEIADLIENVAKLFSIKKELTSIDAAIMQDEQRKKIRIREFEEATEKITKANELILRKDELQVEYQAFISLQKERDDLDTKRDLYRGIETQLQNTRSSFAVKRAEMEGKIQKMELELQVKEREYNDVLSEVASKEAVLEKLENSQKARHKLALLNEKIAAQKELDVEIKEIEQHIYGQKRQLTERYRGLSEQLTLMEKQTGEIPLLREKLENVSAKKEKLSEVKDNLLLIREEGEVITEKIVQIEGELEVLNKEKKRVDLHLAQLKDMTTSLCPTCGSPLNKGQQELLISGLLGERGDLDSQFSELSQKLGGEKRKRDTLREKYRNLVAEENEVSSGVEVFHQLKERLGKLLEINQVCGNQKEKIHHIKSQLDNENYSLEEKERLSRKKREREELELEEGRLKALRFEAAQIERFEERLRKIEFSEGKKESLDVLLEKSRSELKELRQQLDNGDTFVSIKAQIKELERKLLHCDFDPSRFEHVKNRLKEKSYVADMLRDLLEAEKNVAEWEEQLSKLKGILGEIEGNIRRQLDKKKSAADALGDLEVFQASLGHKKRKKQELEGIVLGAREKIGEINARLNQIEEAKEKRKVAKNRYKEKNAELNIYRKLRTAFGKNGIQSLIIEQALPEIEERASEILHRLTEGKMQVHLETIKDKKSGGTKETLEIIITDEQGMPRAYETYSGGEAFRINFALRIALSQILAERNGVRIRTLGIDEGFGTQDEDGIQYLIEAIQQVQDDFDKIIVITHLNRLKEAFPVRIEVAKDPIKGSQLTVLEQ